MALPLILPAIATITASPVNSSQRPEVSRADHPGNDQALCVEPEFLTVRDQPLCGEREAEAVFVRLRAHWLIRGRRRVRFSAQHLIRCPNSPNSCRSTRQRHDFCPWSTGLVLHKSEAARHRSLMQRAPAGLHPWGSVRVSWPLHTGLGGGAFTAFRTLDLGRWSERSRNFPESPTSTSTSRGGALLREGLPA